MVQEKRSRPIQMIFRVNEHEKEVIRKRMELAKTKRQSAFLRKMAMDGMILNVDYSQIREINALIGKVSGNINQIAKRVNSTSRIYPEDIAELKKRQEEIWDLLKSMQSKLL